MEKLRLQLQKSMLDETWINNNVWTIAFVCILSIVFIIIITLYHNCNICKRESRNAHVVKWSDSQENNWRIQCKVSIKVLI